MAKKKRLISEIEACKILGCTAAELQKIAKEKGWNAEPRGTRISEYEAMAIPPDFDKVVSVDRLLRNKWAIIWADKSSKITRRK